MTITRCPACGMAAVAVAGQRTPSRCEHCGQRLEGEHLTRSDSETLELLVRERLYGRRGLGRRRRVSS
jgi:hypothetical protein